ncbi:MAG: CxxC-x17-CxxC domain-containing protein [Terriglobales bacterium]
MARISCSQRVNSRFSTTSSSRTNPSAARTRTNCSQCGKETTVPFRPTQGRPVLCRECFQQGRQVASA